MPYIKVSVRRRGLTQQTFHKQERITVTTGGVVNKIGIFGIEKLDLVDFVKENGFPVFDNLGKSDNRNGLPVCCGAIHFTDQPFSITDQNTGARCKNRNIHE